MESVARYVVATDGACKGNPGPAGWAWVAEDGHWSAGSIPQGTNNIAELVAVLQAIRDHQHVQHLVIQADSKYAIDTYTSWMDGHYKRGWKTSSKQPTKNVDILKSLMAARDERAAAGLDPVEFEHVRGHSGHRLNEWADERAVRAAEHAADGKELVWLSHRGLSLVDTSIDPPRGSADPYRKR